MAAEDEVKQASDRFYLALTRMKKRLVGPIAIGAAVLVVTGMVMTGVAMARTSKPASSIILTA